MTDWNNNQPIFRQLSEQVEQKILQGVWQEGDALPSVRSVAADLKINHLTVMKGYQLLVDQGLVEKKRGQGMFVAQGAVTSLKNRQKNDFIGQQIPMIATTLKQIDMSVDDFIRQLQQHITGEQ
ncbi:GntR family transcriptional regulator [Vibrio sp. SCSIO 43137]|uniref:GntR family transcriptional regulator n=1 Tax=Vibrio sp. SCSIO 43137 TaxID=3021011 RepID=UPI002307F802|nr:GntR family transcriptional regulator [Vibrio sp. SCSIO 43137]WCE30744.1 GntR family transcriptional regulator [Vibrio sp. SCSIO 43137]